MSPTSADETELEISRRHVCEGVVHLAKQRALIARLDAKGIPTGEAEKLLATFEESQRLHEAHLARIEGAVATKLYET